jgi:hypothetical protein
MDAAAWDAAARDAAAQVFFLQAQNQAMRTQHGNLSVRYEDADSKNRVLLTKNAQLAVRLDDANAITGNTKGLADNTKGLADNTKVLATLQARMDAFFDGAANLRDHAHGSGDSATSSSRVATTGTGHRAGRAPAHSAGSDGSSSRTVATGVVRAHITGRIATSSSRTTATSSSPSPPQVLLDLLRDAMTSVQEIVPAFQQTYDMLFKTPATLADMEMSFKNLSTPASVRCGRTVPGILRRVMDGVAMREKQHSTERANLKRDNANLKRDNQRLSTAYEKVDAQYRDISTSLRGTAAELESLKSKYDTQDAAFKSLKGKYDDVIVNAVAVHDEPYAAQVKDLTEQLRAVRARLSPATTRGTRQKRKSAKNGRGDAVVGGGTAKK